MQRLFVILRTFARYRLDELLAKLPGAGRIVWFLRLVPSLRTARDLSEGQRLRLALQELGPLFIKFGQLLSTRRDLLTDEMADELALLQEKVPPFDGEAARMCVEKTLKKPIGECFSEFATTPLASASVAQVHAATLISGEDVVVKVLRPDIEKVIHQDLTLLKKMAELLENWLPASRRFHPAQIVRDYTHVLLSELDLMSEAANGSQLRRNFENSPLLYVPKVYWDYCTPEVLVLERMYGIPVSDIATLKKEGINIKRLAELGVEIFFTQVFDHSFFHADMHPGNVYVATSPKDEPQYIAFDCAIIGTLSQSDQQYIARNLLAIFERDYRKVAELHLASGWVPPDTPVHAFEATMRAVCEPIFQKPLSEISFGQLLIQLFRTAGRFNMEVQPSLVLLQKTLLNVEGLGKQLYPNLDLWETALPFLRRWQQKRLSPLRNLKKLKKKIPEWMEQAPHFPELVYGALQQQSTAEKREQSLRKELSQVASELRYSRIQLKWLSIMLVVAITIWFTYVTDKI